MNIYLQRLVPIQPRTSPLKFDHLVENFGVKYGIVAFNLAANRWHELPREGNEVREGRVHADALHARRVRPVEVRVGRARGREHGGDRAQGPAPEPDLGCK